MSFERCTHCGNYHDGGCPRVKAIEYYENGTVKRVEYHAPQPVIPSIWPQNIPQVSTRTEGHCSSGLSNACEQDEGA